MSNQLQTQISNVNDKTSFVTLLTSYYSGEFETCQDDTFVDWQEEQSEVYFPSFEDWETFCMDLGIA